MNIDPTLTDILQAGILAPSADNHHRLRFEQSGEGVRLWSVQKRLATLSGYKRTLDLISIGAVIENIILQAGSHHLSADLSLLPEGLSGPVADIRFSPSETPPDPLHLTIPRRHTNRRFFSGPPADADTLQRIADAAIATPGCSLTWLDRPELRRKALSLIRRAEGERFRRKVLHTEMFENICFGINWDESCDEGLPPGSLEVEKPLRPLFKAMRHWPIMRILNLAGAYWQLGWRAGDLPCRFAPHLGVISSQSLADQDQINAGRAFERAWLAIAQRGFALQPMPASVLYAQSAAVGQGIPRYVQEQLSAGWHELLPEEKPLMVFRMGITNAPSLVSGRKPLESYLGIGYLI